MSSQAPGSAGAGFAPASLLRGALAIAVRVDLRSCHGQQVCHEVPEPGESSLIFLCGWRGRSVGRVDGCSTEDGDQEQDREGATEVRAGHGVLLFKFSTLS